MPDTEGRHARSMSHFYPTLEDYSAGVSARIMLRTRQAAMRHETLGPEWADDPRIKMVGRHRANDR